jgi:hypothetical protein
MKIKPLILNLPLIVLFITIIVTLNEVSTTEFILLDKHYVGILLILISAGLVIWGKRQRFGKIATLATLILGTFNIIGFTTEITAYNLSIGGIGFYIQPYSFLLLILFLVLHAKSMVLYLGFKPR